MNKGILQSSPVQQLMMAGNPNWWNINTMRPTSHQQSSPFLSAPSNFLFPPYASTPPISSSLPSLIPSWHDPQEPPESWSQLLMGGLVSEDDKEALGQFQARKMESWEDQMLSQGPNTHFVDVKQEKSVNSYVYGHGSEEFQATKPAWSQVMPATSTNNSCVTSTTFSSNVLDFSHNKTDGLRHPRPDRSDCNSNGGGGAVKKARLQTSSTQPTFKVRKEKLGDRITALHQLVSPFGKTDTASVLLEAIGYIRFLQNQIEALSLPYLGNGSAGSMGQQQPVQGERSCIFPEDPGQLLNDGCMIKRKGAGEQDSQEQPKKDLRSRGLCLVPVSCTLQVGSENGADYWAPAIGGSFR